VKHLKELKGAENLELYSADLMKADSYDEAIRGVKYVTTKLLPCFIFIDFLLEYHTHTKDTSSTSQLR